MINTVFGANGCATINSVKKLQSGQVRVNWTLDDKNTCEIDRATGLHFSATTTTHNNELDITTVGDLALEHDDFDQGSFEETTWHDGTCNDDMIDESNYSNGSTFTTDIAQYWLDTGSTWTATSTSGQNPIQTGDNLYFVFGSFFDNGISDPACNMGGMFSSDFNIDTEAYSVTEDINEVSLKFPQDGSTVGQFEDWTIEATLSTTATSTLNTSDQDAYSIQAYTGLATTTSGQFLDSETEFSISPGSTKTIDLPKNTELPNDTWFGRAKLVYTNVDNTESNVIATSTFNEFIVDADLDTGFTSPTTSTSTDLTITCDRQDNAFSRSFCNLFQNVFIPDPKAVRQFSKLDDGLREKAPWGYVLIIKDELNKLSPTSTTEYELTGTSNLSSSFQSVKDAIKIVLWIFFIATVVKIIKFL